MQWEARVGFEHSEAAAEMARRGVHADPTRPGNWLILSRALSHLGDFNGATDCLREAVVAVPKSAELRLRLVEALIAQDSWEEALPHAEVALALAPDDPRAPILLFNLLIMMRLSDRLDMKAVAALAARNVHLMGMHVRSLDLADRVQWCDSILAENPGHAYARYLKAIAFVALGRMEEACALISVTQLVETVQLGTPEGYPDDETFRAELAQEIRGNPTLRRGPESDTTRSGWQTQVLRQPGAVAVEALLGRIQKAVDAYDSRLVASGDAFACGRPKRARLHTWAVIYEGAGQQMPHMHPAGWITGVYYVSSPRAPGENAYRGSIVLGIGNPIKGGSAIPWGTREIEPVPGRLVIFPSHVPHATVPPGGVDGERICVVFDVVDAAA
jgi:hypothetical protein